MAVTSKPFHSRGWQTVMRPRVALALRLLVVGGLLAAWAVRGVPASLESLAQAVHTPSDASVSYDRQRASLEGYDLYQLLLTARNQCPPKDNILALTDDIRADQQGNYVLYPRSIDVVRLSQSFGEANLKVHAGGCVFFYGQDAYQRFASLQPYLASQVKCVQNGCLYLIKPGT